MTTVLVSPTGIDNTGKGAIVINDVVARWRPE